MLSSWPLYYTLIIQCDQNVTIFFIIADQSAAIVQQGQGDPYILSLAKIVQPQLFLYQLIQR